MHVINIHFEWTDMVALSGIALAVGRAIGGVSVLSSLGHVSVTIPLDAVFLSTALGLTGVIGMAVTGDADDPIEQLTAKVRRAIETDDPVDFTTGRDDEVGALSEAIGELVAASDLGQRERNKRYRRRLFEIASESGVEDEEKIEQLLELGCERLGVEAGLVTRIDEETGRYEIERATEGDVVTEGAVTDLSKTFCRKTVTSGDPLGIFNASEEGFEDDPGYVEWGISCYLGSKLVVDDELYGTLCFVDPEPRETQFTHAEMAFVDLMGRWVSHLLERHQRVEALERNSSLLDSLFEQLPVSLYVKDEDGRHVRKSIPETYEEYLDDEAAYVGKTDPEIYGAHGKESYADDMRVIESGESIRRKTEYDPVNEEWLLTSKVPWRSEDGEIRGLIGITQNITTRKTYERRLEAIVENTTNAIFIKDRDGVYQFANEATARVFGLSPDEIIGSVDEELFDPDSIDQVLEEDRRVLEHGETVSSEVAVTIDGEERVYLSNRYPYRDETGEIVGVMGISQDITERKERERQLRERERELSTLIDNVPGMVYRCRNEPDWPFDFVSDGCRELLGYDPVDLVDGDVSWDEDVLRDDNQELWEAVQQAIDDDESFEVTYEVETADGDRRCLWEQGTPVYDDDGDVEAIEGVIIDITERKRHERELREANERINAVIEASPDAIIAIDSEGAVELWNPAAEELFGWTETEVLGEQLPFVPDDQTEQFLSLRDQLLAGESIRAAETERVTKRGERIDVSLSAAPLHGPDGSVSGIMAVMEDITERKAQERRLRERERDLERYREFTEEILDAVDDVFYVLDAAGRLDRWNSALSEVTGYSDAEIGSMHATDFFPAEHRERMADAIESVLETGETIIEAPYLTSDGRRVPHELVAVRIENPDGETVVAGIGRDITERKRRERELERTTDLLSRAEQMADIGGWATTIEDGEPADSEWTDKQYELFGLDQSEGPLTEGIFEYFHPEDRARHREALERAMDLGVGWDQELRLVLDDGTERWVHNIGEPVIDEDGDVVELRGSMQDITEQKERELALESLHESTRGLLTTGTVDDATALIVDTADSVLDFEATGIFLYDEATNLLEPSSLSDSFERYCDGEPEGVGPGTESVLWHSYVTETHSVVDGGEADGDLFAGDVGSRIVVPIGSHGVFVAANDAGDVEDVDRRLVETLVATAEAALDRLASEARLRERDAEIAEQNERLRRQVRINETIRSVHQSLIGATSQSELEADVCERLIDGDDVAFAWIGGLDPAGDRVEPRAWAGDDQYLDAVSLAREGGGPEPAVETASTGEPTVVENVAQDVQREDWRRSALASSLQSVCAVPIALDEYRYGVLAVYATEPNAFGDLETSVFDELGRSIANALTSITTKQALHSDTHRSLTLHVTDADDLLTTIARATDSTVAYEGLGTRSDDETRLFVRTSGVDPSTVSNALDDRHSVRSHQLVSEHEDELVFEVTVSGDTIVSQIVRHGGRPQSIEADPDGMDIEVDLPVATDVRAFVEMLGESATVELRSHRERTRPLQTTRGVVETILDELTERQVEVLRTAYRAGFFEWPRDSTGEELAAMLDVSQPTVNRHLRLGQQRIMRQLFDLDSSPE